MTGIAYTYRTADNDVSHGYLYPNVERFLRDLPEGSVVFDFGCGNGSFISLFQGKGWQLYGADFSPTGIKVAQESFRDIKFFLADAESPSGDVLKQVGLVDAVITTEVIEHLYNPRAFLQNCYDLLKPGGVMVISTPYHGYLKNLMLALMGKLDSHFTVLWDHGHIKFWSRKTLGIALKEANFTNLEFGGAGRLPLLWKSMVIKAQKPA